MTTARTSACLDDESNRRDFLKILGGGLLVCLTPVCHRRAGIRPRASAVTNFPPTSAPGSILTPMAT